MCLIRLMIGNEILLPNENRYLILIVVIIYLVSWLAQCLLFWDRRSVVLLTIFKLRRENFLNCRLVMLEKMSNQYCINYLWYVNCSPEWSCSLNNLSKFSFLRNFQFMVFHLWQVPFFFHYVRCGHLLM